MTPKIKNSLKQCQGFYLFGFLLILTLKYIARISGADELRWLLTPTARWVSSLSGIPFFYVPQIGYVNHSFEFIIAPSCCGISFQLICIATLLYSYLHRMKNVRQRCIWFLWSVCFPYPYTVFINGLRILISIYLPLSLCRTDFFDRFMSPQTLHTAIGIVVYFSSLLCLYAVSGYISRKISGSGVEKKDVIRKWLLPVFWYLAIVLGIPALGRLRSRNWDGFREYAFLVLSICLIVLLLLSLPFLLNRPIKGHRKFPESC